MDGQGLIQEKNLFQQGEELLQRPNKSSLHAERV